MKANMTIYWNVWTELNYYNLAYDYGFEVRTSNNQDKKLLKYFMCITFCRIIEHGMFAEVKYPNCQIVSKFQLCYYIVLNRPSANYIIYDHMSKCQRNFIWFCKQKSHCKDFFSAFTQKSLLVLRYRCWGGVNFFLHKSEITFSLRHSLSWKSPHQHSTTKNKLFLKYIIHKKLYFF